MESVLEYADDGSHGTRILIAVADRLTTLTYADSIPVATKGSIADQGR